MAFDKSQKAKKEVIWNKQSTTCEKAGISLSVLSSAFLHVKFKLKMVSPKFQMYDSLRKWVRRPQNIPSIL